jgi:predicted secreted hydrolase
VSLARRALLAVAAAWPARAWTAEVRPRPLEFPRDFGAHPQTRIEWWYATGWLSEGAAPAYGFQLTFFRSRTGLAADSASRFAARHLLLAHLALTDLAEGRLRHAERVARWNEDPHAAPAAASLDDTRVHIGRWRLAREAAGAAGSVYRAALDDRAAAFALQLTLATTQPLLLQGDAGFSRKGPQPHNASHYYSQPQLAVDGTLVLDGRSRRVRGRAWLDHEWSDSLLPDAAVGWDWIGMNLDDGSALTAFRLRDAVGRALWAGGSFRVRGAPVQAFDAAAVHFEALAWWSSAATGARYPVRWRVTTPAGSFDVLALLDAQELDARTSTGSVYWEGLAELRDGNATRRGWGYLEMTGYAGVLRL